MVSLWTLLWPNKRLFWDNFMVVSWLVLWPNWGLFWDCWCLILWLGCGLLCGLNDDCFGAVFVPYFMACFLLVFWLFGAILWTLYVSYLAHKVSIKWP